MNWEDEGILLLKKKFRENANIVNFFTKNHGKTTGIVYGGNSRKIKNYLQIGNRIHLNHKSKNDNKIGYFQTELIEPISPKYFDDNGSEIYDIQKEKCYVFEFSPNRTLQLITEYAVSLNTQSEYSHEQKIQQFLNFLPVLAYEGDSMYLVDAKQALEFSYSGIGMSMLAERWKSRLLVNVNNDALERLMEHPDIIEALENMDDFVNLNDSVSK